MGLYNLGNTCYMDAALQCMIHTPHLVSYVAKGPAAARGSSPCSYELFNLIKESINNSAPSGAIKPSDLKYQMGKKYSQFAGMGQQDAIEFLHELLELTNKEQNRVTSKVAYKALSQTGEPISVQVLFPHHDAVT